MKPLLAVMLFLAVAVPASSASAAGGLIQQLPADGTRVTYFAEFKVNQPQVQEMTGTLILRSVGAVTENGVKCRWIEIQFDGEQNGKKQTSIMKFLVKESDFKPGAKEAVQVLRGWKKENDKLSPLSEAEKAGNGPLAFFIGGNLTDRTIVKQSRTIDYQKGQLKIASAARGTFEVKISENAPPDFKYVVQQTIWNHQSIPFGAAALDMKMQIKNKDNVVAKFNMTFTVQDYGTGARSALPENN